MIKLITFVLTLLATTPSPPKKYDIEATATVVYNDYCNNKSKADAKYLNKQVFLHGIVQERSGNLWHVYLRIPNNPEGMCATIGDDQLTRVPMYKPGDSFDLICKGVGLVFNIPLFLECKMP